MPLINMLMLLNACTTMPSCKGSTSQYAVMRKTEGCVKLSNYLYDSFILRTFVVLTFEKQSFLKCGTSSKLQERGKGDTKAVQSNTKKDTWSPYIQDPSIHPFSSA